MNHGNVLCVKPIEVKDQILLFVGNILIEFVKTSKLQLS